MSDFNNRSNKFREMEGYQTTANAILSASYMWMTLGLIVTGLVAYFVAQSPSILAVIYGNTMMPWILIIGQIALVWYLSARIFHMSVGAAVAFFLLYAGLLGLTLSSLLFIYTQQQIYVAFFVSAGMFAGAGIFGKTTKQDLTSIGSFARMAIIGIIIASVINFFMKSSTLNYMVSFIGVVLFTALTAYDTQKIANWQNQVKDGDTQMINRLSIMGALTLYLDFINMFLFMLRLLNRRN